MNRNVFWNAGIFVLGVSALTLSIVTLGLQINRERKNREANAQECRVLLAEIATLMDQAQELTKGSDAQWLEAHFLLTDAQGKMDRVRMLADYHQKAYGDVKTALELIAKADLLDQKLQKQKQQVDLLKGQWFEEIRPKQSTTNFPLFERKEGLVYSSNQNPI